MMIRVRGLIVLSAVLLAHNGHSNRLVGAEGKSEHHFLYVAAPGIRNYLEFGGAGILVFDIDNGHSFVKRIETPASRKDRPENIKGVCACAATGRLYFTTLTRLYSVDLKTDIILVVLQRSFRLYVLDELEQLIRFG